MKNNIHIVLGMLCALLFLSGCSEERADNFLKKIVKATIIDRTGRERT